MPPATESTTIARHAPDNPDAALFGELRSLLQQAPSEAVWEALCALLESVTPSPRFEEVERPYLESHLRSWPDALRVAPAGWVTPIFMDAPSPLLQWARVVDLRAHYLYGEPIWQLAHHADMRGVTALWLADNNLGDQEARTLAQASSLRALRHLSLDSNDLFEEGARALASHGALASLESLSAGDTHIGSQGFLHLTCSPLLPSLQALDLHFAAITHEPFIAALRRCWLPTLTHLDLSNNPLRVEALLSLLSCAGLPRLRSIGWSRNTLTDEGAVALASQATLGGIVRLALAADLLTDRGAIALLRSPHLASLRALDLSQNMLTDDVLLALPRIQAPLEALDLSYCSMITDEGLAALEPPKTLAWLNLRYTGVSAAGVERLRARHPTLHVEWFT